MDARQISRIGLVVALLAVSAWVTVPFGPVPFTLQTMALALVPAVRVLPETMPRPARVLVVDAAMLLIAYACGTAQLMAVASLELVPALAMAVFPFIVPDAVKLAIGSRVGCVVARAEERRAGGIAA